MSTFDIKVDEDIFSDIPDDADTLTVIAHGVNTVGVMGGFAALIERKYQYAANFYQVSCRHGAVKPGSSLIVSALGVDTSRSLWVAHVASQENPGADARLGWLISGLNDMYRKLFEEPYKPLRTEVRLPLIGGGIGGLEPNSAAAAIRACASQFALKESGIHTSLYLLGSDPHTQGVVEENRLGG